MTLDLYRAHGHDRTREWTTLTPEERRRRAVEASAGKDADMLWSLVEAYLHLRGQSGVLLSPHTVRAYRAGVRQFVRYADTNAWNLLRPDPDQAQLWINHLLKVDANSIATVRSRTAAAVLLYRSLKWARACDVTPFADVVIPRDPRHPLDKNPPYTEAQLSRVFEQVAQARQTAPPEKQRQWVHTQALLLLLAHTGLRIEEALKLRWHDVDFQEGQLTVTSGKGRKSRVVPLSRRLQRALEHYRLLVPAAIHVLPYRTRMGAAYHLAPLFGDTWRGFHAFRKLTGTRLYEELEDFVAVAEMLGHADVNTTRAYVRVSNKRIRRTVADW